MMRQIIKASTDQSVIVRIVDASDGTPEQAVEHDTSGLSLWYRREGAALAAITPVALASASTAHTDGGIEHIDDGYYRIDLPDAAVATGANGVLVGGACTGMIVIGCYAPLIDFNIYSATLGTDVIAAASLSTAAANKIRDAITAAIVETQGNYTVAQALSLVLAGVFGRTNAGTFSTPNNGATRATVSYTGNDRTSVTLSP
jgi:hypothetical protein